MVLPMPGPNVLASKSVFECQTDTYFEICTDLNP